MKHNIRFENAHVGWQPKPYMTVIKPCQSALDGFRLPREDRGAPVDVGQPATAQREFVERHAGTVQAKPHPWAERRKDVIEAFPNVRDRVTPIGYEDAWDPEMTFDSPEDEWNYINATARNELPPDWLTLRANGVRADSLNALVESEDGDYTLADVATSDSSQFLPSSDWEDAFELLGGMRRVEAFLKAEDEQKWFTGRVRRYALVVNEHGKRGIVRLNRSISDKQMAEDWESIKQTLPPVEEVERAMEHRESHTQFYRDDQGRQRREYVDGTFRKAEDLQAKALYLALNEIELGRVEEDIVDERVEQEQYRPNTPCPNPKCDERGEDCVVCWGDGYILHTLGVDGEMDSTYGTWRQEQQAWAHHSSGLRKSLKRLDDDLKDIEAHKQRSQRAKRGYAKPSDESLDSLPF